MQNQNSNLAGGIFLASLVVSLLVSGLVAWIGHTPDQSAKVAEATQKVDALQEGIKALIKAGALTGPEVASPFLQWGGVNHWAAGAVYGNTVMATSSAVAGTFCSIPVPYGTQLLVRASWRPDTITGIATTAVFDVATSTNTVGTSSPALMVAVPFNVNQAWAPISTTSTAIVNGFALASQSPTPNGAANSVYVMTSTPSAPLFLNFRISTTTSNVVIPSTVTGNCQAEWMQL